MPLESRLRYTSGRSRHSGFVTHYCRMLVLSLYRKLIDTLFAGYSPHHTTTSRGGAYSPQHSSSTGSSTRVSDSRDPGGLTRDHGPNVYNVGTLGTRLGNTLLSRAGAQSPARSPATETYKHLESARSVQFCNDAKHELMALFYAPSTHNIWKIILIRLERVWLKYPAN